jgi:hypothetical protein
LPVFLSSFCAIYWCVHLSSEEEHTSLAVLFTNGEVELCYIGYCRSLHDVCVWQIIWNALVHKLQLRMFNVFSILIRQKGVEHYIVLADNHV